MPEAERSIVQNELERMIENSIRHGRNQRFEKLRYMELVLQKSTGANYTDLDAALTANAANYDRLYVTTSNAGMIAGEIRRTYFHGNLEDVLINGLDRNDCQELIRFLNDRLAQLRAAI